MLDKFYVGKDITGFTDNGKMRGISRVTFMVDDDKAITAGDDTGLEIRADNPHATQEMANAILEQLKGYQYHMYTADAANIDPAAELGDGVTTSGIYSVISQLDDTGNGYLDLSAPGESELEDEYPTEGPLTQAFNQKLADTRATITKTADEIRLEVKQGDENTLNTAKSEIKQAVDGISLSVTNGETSSSFVLKSGSATLSSGTITFSGVVTFTDLSTAGKTTINGGNITTGSISANRISGGTLTLGGSSNGNGTFRLNNSSGTAVVTMNNSGITATAGTIGNWTISSDRLSSSENGYAMGLIPGNIGKASSRVIYVRTSTSNNIFSVFGDGTVVATSGTFGSITINSSGNSAGTFAGTNIGTLTGTHSGGSLSGVGGTFTGTNSGTLSGTASGALLNNCNLNRTALSTGQNGSFSSLSNGYSQVYGSGTVGLKGGDSINLTCSGNLTAITGNLSVGGKLEVTGDKNRAIDTHSYGKILLSAFETPLPTFSDYGTASLDENGVCYITIDPIFAETVNKYYLPTVFLTKYGDGDIWVDAKETDINTISIKGTPNITFSWHALYLQRNCDTERLSSDISNISISTPDYEFESKLDIEHTTPDLEISAEQYLNLYAATARKYGDLGAEYIEEYERGLIA